MIKQILHRIITMIIGIIMLVVIGGLITVVTSVVVSGGVLEVVPAAFFMILCLFPAILLYHASYALKLKKIICDTLYFISFLSIELFFLSVITRAFWFYPRSEREGIGFWIFFFYIFTFIGVAVYLAEVIFRNQKLLKRLEYEDKFNETNWGDMFGQVLRQPKSIFVGIIKSYVVAFIVIFIASTGEGFVNCRIELAFIIYGLLFSLCLLPAIILYQSSRSLKLKRWICDIVFFVGVIVGELPFLPFVLKINMYSSDDLDYLPIFGMSVIALGSIVVYMAEVYFRDRAILKNYEQK